MPRDRAQAQLLARALDGERPADGETAALAALLELAAESARVDVPVEEVERALAGVRPRLAAPHGRRRFRLAAAGVALAAAVAAVFVLLVISPFSGAPGVDVEARAAEALGGADTVLSLTLRIEPAEPGLFAASGRIGWLDPSRGRARWTQTVGGRAVAETLVEPGEVRRYLVSESVLLTGDTCRAFASGCTDLVDPVATYREALASGEARVSETSFRGRRAYLLVLPVQELPDATRVEQAVYVDAGTYVPLRIVWRDAPEQGPPQPVAEIDVVSLRLVDRDEAPTGAFELEVPEGVEVVRREEAAGAGAARRLDVAAARALDPSLLWLGESYRGRPLTSIEEVDVGAGVAHRLRYGTLTIWNYAGVVPTDVLAARGGQAKTVPVRGGVASFYATSDGLLVADWERAGRSVAVVAPELAKVDVIDVLEHLQPLR